ncbi:MAG: hypothetical protein L0332_28075 [Chloroflexi bacterium]|nr:hypothetical protein [Chloroflexota bacterium]MCI0574777.1 hypothetical protein [Chloroflexota bacterium]MCI0648852.1 hypothetical protein [Chloroflexota bacterium]MCI0730558.1 hypothetical protein [Chloroflexota bacterium]
MQDPYNPAARSGRPHTLWQAFEAAGYEERLALLQKTLAREPEIVSGDVAARLLETLFYQAIDHDERGRFDALVETLRAQAPEAYRSQAHQFLEWRLANALADGRPEETPALARELAGLAAEHPQTFNNNLDRLAYHDCLATLVEMMRLAWEQVRQTAGLPESIIREYSARATDYEIFHYLEQSDDPDAHDPALLARLEFYFAVNHDGLAHYLAVLAGRVGYRWNLEHFPLEQSGRQPDAVLQNLNALTVEFAGYLRQVEGVAYAKAALARPQILHYLLRRPAGDLVYREGPLTMARRPVGSRPAHLMQEPDHPLCPDRETLERFLDHLLFLANPQIYKAAATYELLPAWLRFLESQGLIDAARHRQTLADLKEVDTELIGRWTNNPADPALQANAGRWPE